MNLKISIKRSAFFILMATAAFSIFSISALWVYTEIAKSQGSLEKYKEAYENEQREYIKKEVKRVVELIEFTLDFNSDKNLEDIKSDILHYVTQIRLKHGGYIFINTYDGKALIFDAVKIIGDKDISNMTDPDGLRLFDIEMKCASNNDGDYFRYKFKRLDSFTPVPKLSYALGYNDWEWIIGAGIYLDDVEVFLINIQNQHKSILFRKILYIALLFVALLLILFAVSNYLSGFFKKEFSVFTSFFSNTQKEYNTIDQKDLRIDEFKSLAHSLNLMIKRRKVIEKLLKKERDKARGYLNVAGVIILALDAEGFVTMINKKGCLTLGYNEEEIINKNWFTHFVPIAEKQKLYDMFLQVMKNKEKMFLNRENSIIGKSGKERIISWHNTLIYDDNNNIIGSLSSGLDITESRQFEANFSESERKYKLLFEKSSDPVLILDENNNFIDCNKAALNILGYTDIQNFIGLSPSSISPEFQPDGKKSESKALEMIAQAYEHGFKRFEWQHLSKENGAFFVDISLTAIPISGTHYLYVVWRDISENKKQEKELIIAKEKAEESDLIKTSFLNNMQHEIRTPLNAIMGFTQLLKQQILNKSEQDEYYDDILTSGNQLSKIIDKIIDFARLQSGFIFITNEKIELKKLIVDIFISYHTNILSNDIEFTIKSYNHGKSSYINTDVQKVSEIIGHLLDNAFKFTEQGEIELKYEISDEVVTFSVKDTGVGIKKKFFKSIFGKFNRLSIKNSEKLYGGNGLGLSISKETLKFLGGEIWVESEKDKGSVFSFTVPYKPLGTDMFKEDKILNNKDFAIITKNNSLYQKYHDIISSKGGNLWQLKSGMDAVKHFQDNMQTDLLLVDEKIKGMNFITTTKAIKAFNTNLPIVALSTESNPVFTKENALIAGCSNYILNTETEEEIVLTLSITE